MLRGILRGKKEGGDARQSAVRRTDRVSYEQSKEIARHGTIKARRELAANSSTRPEVLYFLAEDKEPQVRREVASNSKTPRQADLILAKDVHDEVRCDLALKIARLVPEASAHESARLQEITFEVLEILAHDQLPRVRQILAEELKHSDVVPKKIVGRLARDVELVVAAPILEYSPLLSDEDLLEIIAAGPAQGGLSAIARRAKVSVPLSDAVVRANDIPAVAALLGNKNAQIREETLDQIIDTAERIGDTGAEMHEPLARRPGLSQRALRRVAGFVASSVLHILQQRHDLDTETAQQIATKVKDRMVEEEKAKEVNAAMEKARKLHEKGQVTDKGLAQAIAQGEREVIVHALALKTEMPLDIVRRIMVSRNGKTITALNWKAGLSMRTAVTLQRQICGVPQKNLVLAREGIGYPLSEDEMSWYLDFFAE
jgi:uncharacterized protein (DUF2336 family)